MNRVLADKTVQSAIHQAKYTTSKIQKMEWGETNGGRKLCSHQLCQLKLLIKGGFVGTFLHEIYK